MEEIIAFQQMTTSSQFDLSLFSDIGQQYEAAKARLMATQEEKMEAVAELMALRASLSVFLEAIWPDPTE